MTIKQLLHHLIQQLAFTLLCFGSATGQIVFDDGQEHILNLDVSQPVQVRNGSFVDVQSTIESSTPALAVDRASAELNGGTIAFPPESSALEPIVSLEDADFVINAGDIRGSGILAINSQVKLNGGQINPDENRGIVLTGSSSARINGGSISSEREVGGGVWLEDSSTLLISDGLVAGAGYGVRLSDNASTEMTGGTLDGYAQFDSGNGGGVLMTDTSVFRMLAGTVRGNAFEGAGTGFTLQQHSALHLFGGEIIAEDFEFSRGRHLQVFQDATVTLYGSDFSFPLFEPIQAVEGTIAGVLQDGTAIEWVFLRDATATILLVPEPSGFIPFAIAVSGVLSRRRRRR